MADKLDVNVSLDAYRRLTRWAYVVTAALFGVIGTAATALTSGLHLGALATATAAGLLTCVNGARWPRHLRFGLLKITAVIGVLGWGVAVWIGASPAVGFALFLPLAYAIATRRPWWPWATLATAAIVLAPVIAGVSGRLDGERWLTDQVAAVLFLCAEVIVFLSLELGWVVFARMDAHRANENELAVTRERLRFANDLHDVQGHTLVAIKLKAELARRSLDRAPNTTRHELADIEALVADVSAQTRQIANVYRTVTLATELANVKQLLTTTGIVTTIDPVPTMLGDWEPLVATAVREGVSNILRHSAASTVSIRFAPDTVTISNDGVRAKRSTAADGGNGLVSLQTRFAEHGGSLDWRHHGDTFTVTARYAARGEAR
ncbi:MULTISPECIES: sensor histidine kinase [Brachybacterium]|uniref:Signal transduction histidine kinase subgroup 3 dimerisation and phosphoacceptor domain-containing protein n=1 Tax=Brachybacterium alimentarium TaxID=47845 RepID=A0A2A3YHR3_9MICO|nr:MULTISPECIES: histidine kinase [Brachybacterium]MDN5586054.1 histidine kinase [Brevibacterium sp.]PCC31473.1 hypothetical protein CIK71_13910 [Brachybacterium alimentarium]PCC38834.1 hypothetical protein CIK66_13010 [Brachybacterium alimentarium]RCS65037.1 hypothetical protein CIK81_06905 [Brachybacterium sp. JB7]RCS68796.1 hypothetical protein CIK73_06210 [Brachybacterium alimentarium]